VKYFPPPLSVLQAKELPSDLKFMPIGEERNLGKGQLYVTARQSYLSSVLCCVQTLVVITAIQNKVLMTLLQDCIIYFNSWFMSVSSCFMLSHIHSNFLFFYHKQVTSLVRS